MSTTREWTEHPELVEYYSSHRTTADELYPSERRFLPWLAREAQTVLDVGCGAGGFAGVWREFNPELDYTGVDTSEALVRAARRLVPDARFEHADAINGLPFDDRSADVVAALGWLHWEEQHERALTELWRVTRTRLFFDVRLHDRGEQDELGDQRLALVREWDGTTTVPYVVRSWRGFGRALARLQPARVLAHGYWGSPADTVRGVSDPVCFTTFVLERGETQGTPALDVDLPIPLAEVLT